jgi:NADH-quinone oxidoreductase subunit K
MTTETGLTTMLALSAAMFCIGLFGVMARRTILFQLISLEVMLSAPALAFIAAGAHHGRVEGQGMFVMVLGLAAAEVALGLAFYLRLRRANDSGDSDVASSLKG